MRNAPHCGAQVRESSPTFGLGVGEHPAAHPPQGLDRSATEDDAAGGASAWSAGAGRGGPDRLGTWVGIEGYGNLRAAALVESLMTASTPDVPPIIKQLTGLPPLGRSSSRSIAGEHQEPERSPSPGQPRQHRAVAGDGKQAEYLEDRLLAASPVDLPVVWEFLRGHDRGADPRLWKLLEDPKADPERRFRAACALARSIPPRSRTVGTPWPRSSSTDSWRRCSRTPATTRL